MGINKQVFKAALDEALGFLAAALKFSAALFCLSYVFWWGFDRQVRKMLRESLLWASVIGGFLSLAEEVCELEKIHALNWLPPFLQTDAARWVFLVIALLLLLAKIFEWFSSRRQHRFVRFFAVNLEKVFNLQATISYNRIPEQIRHSRGVFVYGLLQDAKKVFKSSTLRYQIMLQGSDLRLRTIYTEPLGAHFARDYVPNPGEGAAGLAFQTQEVVYVPSKFFRQGIRKGRRGYELARNVFVSSKEGDPFGCVLCAPIHAEGKTYGVLNLVCNETNAFGDFDFEIAEIMASFLAAAIDTSSGKMILPKTE
jgi:GAF domain